MTENGDWFKDQDIKKEKIVFFASGSDSAGKRMASDFVNVNLDYANYDLIFMRSKYSKDLGGVDASRGKYAMAASHALAMWARHPIVFNSNNGKPLSTIYTQVRYLTMLKRPRTAFG
jgi:hypothetical protein